MKALKYILIGLVVLVGAALAIAAVTKKDYAVVREISINKPKQEVFDYIKYLKNQDNFSKWATMDPEMKKTFTGTDGEVGFVSAWESQKDEVGVGEQEIKKISNGERVDFELRFKKPFEATDNAYMTTTEESATQTKVQWGFSGHMAFPMNLMLLVMDFDKMLGNDLQQGLDKLKVVLESTPSPAATDSTTVVPMPEVTTGG